MTSTEITRLTGDWEFHLGANYGELLKIVTNLNRELANVVTLCALVISYSVKLEKRVESPLRPEKGRALVLRSVPLTGPRAIRGSTSVP